MVCIRMVMMGVEKSVGFKRYLGLLGLGEGLEVGDEKERGIKNESISLIWGTGGMEEFFRKIDS